MIGKNIKPLFASQKVEFSILRIPCLDLYFILKWIILYTLDINPQSDVELIIN